jgi:hypothetical protein
MDTVPAEFNEYYGLVGSSLAAQAILLHGSFESAEGNSRLVPLLAGPYRETLLEVQYTKDEEKILRFRFVKKDAKGFSCGKYSEWQTSSDSMVRSYRYDSTSPDRVHASPDHVSKYNERFDKEAWINCFRQVDRVKVSRTKQEWKREFSRLKQIWHLFNLSRTKQTWDLLHSYPLIGMKSKEVLALLGPESQSPDESLDDRWDPISYYQISRRSACNESTPVPYLELKYSHDRVSAFRLKSEVQEGRPIVQESSAPSGH